MRLFSLLISFLMLFETTPFAGIARTARSHIRKGLHSYYRDRVTYTKYNEEMKMWDGYYTLDGFGDIGFRDVHRTSYTW
jgi:hypothetical protein